MGFIFYVLAHKLGQCVLYTLGDLIIIIIFYVILKVLMLKV